MTSTPGTMHPGIFVEILKSMREGVLVVNDQNVIQLANESARTILGLESNVPLVGKQIGEIPSVDPEKNLPALLSEIEIKEDAAEKKNSSTNKSASSIKVFRDESNLSAFRIIILHDTGYIRETSESAAEHARSLEKSNKELDQFAHIVSHDLKAPLRAISNLSLWLEEDLGASLSGENRDNFIKLRSRVVRMESLINGILQYSKAGTEQIADESIDVYELLLEVIELLAPASHIKIRVNSSMPVLVGPKIMLLQVFSNLLSNAIKYNDKTEGLVNVYCSEKADCFEFVVEDNGPGISPEYHEKIFVIFQTLQSRDKFESTGIGLTIVKRIVMARGGAIRVESSLGQGSKFIFTWPK